MKMFERIVIPTILDPIPRSFRACLGHIVLNQREIDACRRNSEDDRDTIHIVHTSNKTHFERLKLLGKRTVDYTDNFAGYPAHFRRQDTAPA